MKQIHINKQKLFVDKNENVWEAYADHQTLTFSEEHGKLGLVSTRTIPAAIAALPYGTNRAREVIAHHKRVLDLSHEVVLACRRLATS